MRAKKKPSREVRDEVVRLSGLFTFHVEERLNELGLSRAGLARKMGVSKSSVTAVLNKEGSVTFLTIAKVGLALDLKWNLHPIR